MKNMEIERKFLVTSIPMGIRSAESHKIEQYYISYDPLIRIRKDSYRGLIIHTMTMKSNGFLSREEQEIEIDEFIFDALKVKASGASIHKRRYLMPLKDGLIAELDIFEKEHMGLILAEVEFRNETEALSFIRPQWFGEDVTNNPNYYNKTLSQNPSAFR